MPQRNPATPTAHRSARNSAPIRGRRVNDSRNIKKLNTANAIPLTHIRILTKSPPNGTRRIMRLCGAGRGLRVDAIRAGRGIPGAFRSRTVRPLVVIDSAAGLPMSCAGGVAPVRVVRVRGPIWNVRCRREPRAAGVALG